MTSSTPPLPEGFYDLLSARARTEQALERDLLTLFDRNGYCLVAPPLIEYEESMRETQPDFDQLCFRVVDSATQRMMAIRCDMTLQAARIAATRLSDAPRPLRLCYAGESLRTQATAARPRRQFSQIGCEIFGCEGWEADVEILRLVCSGLELSAVESPLIEMATPELTESLVHLFALEGEERTKFSSALSCRNRQEAEALSSAPARSAALSLLSCCGEARATYARLQALTHLPPVALLCRNLGHLFSLAAPLFERIPVMLDPLETRGFRYQSGFAFTLLSKNSSAALGRGGRYRSPFDGSSATGCSFYLDALAEKTPPPEQPRRVYATKSASRQTIERMRQKGVVVVEELDAQPDSMRTAREQTCHALLTDEGEQPLPPYFS